MSTMPYHVDLTIGYDTDVLQWSIDSGDAADFGPLGGLQITEGILDDLWPPADDVVELRMQLLMPSFAAIAQIKLGSIVYLTIDTAAVGGQRLGDFNGRVSDLQARPHPLGILVTLVCVDFTADLRGRTILYPGASQVWPGQSWDDWNSTYRRISAAAQQLGYGPSPLPIPAASTPNGPQNPSQPLGTVLSQAVERGEADAYEYMQNTCRQFVMEYPGYTAGGAARAILTPVMGNGPMREPTAWTVRPRFERPYFVGPFRLTYTAGAWSHAVSGLPTTGSVPAAAVDFTSAYSATRDANVNVIEARHNFGVEGYPDEVVSASLGINPPVIRVIETDLDAFASLDRLARLYLPAAVPTTEWVPDTFVYNGALDLPGTAVPDDLSDVVTVTGVPITYSPSGDDYVTGQLARRVLTITGGQVVFQLDLRRPDFDADPAGAIRFDSPVITAPGSGRPVPTFANVDPDLTIDTARLIRGDLT